MTNAKGRCIDPANIAVDDLVAFAMGEATIAVSEHVGRCPFCQTRAGEYVRPAQLLSKALYRRSCLPSTTLSQFVLGMLNGDELGEAAAHLIECPHCRQERDSLATFLREPDEVLEPVGILESIRRLIATPLMPSLSPSMRGAEFRGTEVPGAVIFVADECRVTLSAQPSSNGRAKKVIVGMVESKGGFAEDAEVDLLSDGRLVATESTDVAGNFYFDDLAPGTYALELRLEDTAVSIESFEVDAKA